MSLLGKSQILIWVFYVVMTTLNTPSGVQSHSVLGGEERGLEERRHRPGILGLSVDEIFRLIAESDAEAERIATLRTAVTMSSPREVYVLDQGESVHLKCEFLTNSFNLFDNSVTWIKTQKDKQTQISIMGNLLEPYGVNGRYFLTVTLKQPRYSFTLSILDVSLEDDGNYTCEVRGRRSSATVTHSLFIQDVTKFSQDKVYVLGPGQSVTLECFFITDGFSPSYKPFTWWRKNEKGEETAIRWTSRLFEPYKANRKYITDLTHEEPLFSFTLSIMNVSVEDSGSYTCEVGGQRSTVVNPVTHHLFIRAVMMSSIRRVYDRSEGRTVQLRCDFFPDGFDLFNHTVTWRKNEEGEQTAISSMSHILEPYGATGRYALDFTSKFPRYSFTLSIKNLSLRDSGNYTCEVRGQRSSATVTHSLFVREMDPYIAHILRHVLRVHKASPEESGSGEE